MAPTRVLMQLVMTISIFPQTVRFGVLSWKEGTRRAGWVARGSERGPRTGWSAVSPQTGWASRGSELKAGTALAPRGSELIRAGPGARELNGWVTCG